jgi:hypothetical protein
MSVQSFRELPRLFEKEVGQSPTLIRRFVVTLSDDTLVDTTGAGDGNATTALSALGEVFGSTSFGLAHPEFSTYTLAKVRCEEGYEGSPYHMLVVGEYGVIDSDLVLSPASRSVQWSFTQQQQDVPALYYYSGSGNGTQYPLTNSAYDYFQGLTVKETLVRASAVVNYASFPSSQMASTNSINNASYFGGAAHTWLVEGIASELQREEFAGTIVTYWRTTIQLLYRQTGWNLLLPDVGFNFLAGGQKRRAMVFDFQNAEWVASPGPVGLDGSGNQTLGAPAILNRRIYPEVNFTSLFPTPPS